MSVYAYPQSKVIDSITFRRTEKGTVRAYLHARPNADESGRHDVLNALQAAGFDCIPYDLDGLPTLEVRGFKREQGLLDVLNKWLPGTPNVVTEKQDHITTWDKVKKRTLQLSGITYLIGDYGFVKYNYRESDKLGVAGAFSYFLGTLALIFYGRNDQSDLQVKNFSKDLKHYLQSENIKLSPGSALHEISKDKEKTTLQCLDDFARRYPSEIFNSVTALAGAFVAASAYKKVQKASLFTDLKARREHTHEGWMDVGLGTMTLASGILATIVKEKKPDPDEPPAKGMKWVWQKVQAHPLAIAGGGYTISTLFHAASTYKAYKEAKRVNDQLRLKSVPGRALFVGMALLSEFLLAISSKGHGQGVVSDNSVNNSAISLAADVIAMQPEDKREHLIDGLAKHLSQPDVLAMKHSDVHKQLTEHVQAMRKNPWAMCSEKSAPQVPDALPELSVNEKAIVPGKSSAAAWQAKVAAGKNTPLEPSLST